MVEPRSRTAAQRDLGPWVLLAQGAEAFDKALHLQVSQASASAVAAVKRAGGSVTTVYYNALGLRALFKPEWFAAKRRLLPRPARPPASKAPKCAAFPPHPSAFDCLRDDTCGLNMWSMCRDEGVH